MFHFSQCSLVTPTYNSPEALSLFLKSVLNQSRLPDEVIIGDDGSDEKTREVIEDFKKTFPVPLIHVWQESNGNNIPQIMNKAIVKAKSDYIIMVGSNNLIHPDFVKDHLRFAKKGQYLYGSSVEIKKSYLDTLFDKEKIKFGFFSKGIKKRGRSIHLPFLSNFYKPVDKRSKKLKGFNMSFRNDDFMKVNGFNEELVDSGIYNSEMIQRFLNLGLKGKRLKFAGIAYDIYNTEQSISQSKINQEIERDIEIKRIIVTDLGVAQHL